MFKIALRYIRGHKKNAITTIIGIAFSVMLMFSLIQMGNCVINSYKKIMLSANPVDFYIKDITEAKSKKLEEAINKGDIKVEQYTKVVNIGEVYYNNEMQIAQVIGKSGKTDGILNIDIKEGKLPNKLKEICIDEEYNNTLDNPYHVGDEIDIKIIDDDDKDHKMKFNVCGIIREDNNDSESTFLVSYEMAMEIINKKEYKYDRNQRSDIIVIDKDKCDKDKFLVILNQIKKLIYSDEKNFYKDHIGTNEEKQGIYDNGKLFNGIGGAIKLIALFIAICMIIFVFNIVYINVIEKIKQYGAMRCIGMSKKQMNLLMILEMLIYSISGIAIGLVGGNILNNLVANDIIDKIITFDGGIDFVIKQNIKDYILVIALALISVGIAAILIIRKVRKLTPIQALNYNETQGVTSKKILGINGKSGKNTTILLANRNLKRNKFNTAMVVTTLVFSGMLMMIITNAFLSFNKDMETGKEKIADYELYTDAANEKHITHENIRKLEELEDVEELYKIRSEPYYDCKFSKEIKEKGKNVYVRMLVYDNKLYKELLKIHEELGKIDYMNKDVAICYIPEHIRYSAKDVTVELTASKDFKEEFKKAKYSCKVKVDGRIDNKPLIGGYTENSSLPYLIINEKLAKKIYRTNYDYTDVMIKLKKDSKTTIKDITNCFNSLEGMVYKEIDKEDVESAEQLKGVMILASYVLLSTILASAIIINNMVKASILTRTKENGILRAIGMSNIENEKVICTENTIIGIVSSLIAIIIALPINIVMTYQIRQIFLIKYESYILATVFIVVFCYIISKVTVKKANKMSVIDMLHEEN